MTVLRRLLCAALLMTALAPATAAAAKPRPVRDVMVVSNNWAGTADLVDPRTFKRLDRIDVIPDKAERVAEIRADATSSFYYDNVRALIGEGHDQYVDDGFTSPDGRTVYFSRPSFADVVAIDLATHELRWRTHIDGYRADHMALRKDGRQLLVSASTANVIDVIDPRTGAITARIPAGDQPHESNYSRDGKRIYNASIGQVFTDTDDPSEAATKGRRVFEVIDAKTLQVRQDDRHGGRAGGGRPPRDERRRAPDGPEPGRALRLLPGVVLLRHRQVRPAQGARGRTPAAAAGRRQGPAADRVPARLGPPRPGDEPAGDQAVRRGHDVPATPRS